MNRSNYVLALLVVISLTGCFKSREQIAREREEREMRAQLQQNVVEANQAMEKMQAEIGRLQGKIEELEYSRKKEMSSVASSHEGTEKTITELKSKLEETQKTQSMLIEELKKQKEENLQLIRNMEKSRASNPPPSTSGGKKVSASFESAVSAYKGKDYAASAAGFRAFLDANPKGKKTNDARFLLADSLYKQKQYEDAIVEFGVLHEKTPASALGRKSTLRIAESFKALGKEKEAKAFAQMLVQTNPNTAEAKSARKFLR
jgi:TolA-binding protein